MCTVCPRCRERAVYETETGYLTWYRVCTACGFAFTIKAAVDFELRPEFVDEQLTLTT
jgi:uncharacterized protein (DUF983 family)